MNKKMELVKEYKRQIDILEKRANNHYKKFKKISRVPIEKANYKKESELSNKMWWLRSRIENLEEKINQIEETLPEKTKRIATEIIDPIISNFKGEQ